MIVGNGGGDVTQAFRRLEGVAYKYKGVALIQYRPKSGSNRAHRTPVTIQGGVATTITATMLGLGREGLGQVGALLYILGTRGW